MYGRALEVVKVMLLRKHMAICFGLLSHVRFLVPHSVCVSYNMIFIIVEHVFVLIFISAMILLFRGVQTQK